MCWLFAILMFVFRTPEGAEHTGIAFRFKQKDTFLSFPMQRGAGFYHPREGHSNQTLDTLSNWFDPESARVEMIRQDHSQKPTLGLAMAFEFDENNGEYPYTPAWARMQLKDFTWGGLEFSAQDTLNYTGVSNTVSEDISIEILSFEGDTIRGRFSGLLLNGAGSMSPIENGSFCIRLYRRKG